MRFWLFRGSKPKLNLQKNSTVIKGSSKGIKSPGLSSNGTLSLDPAEANRKMKFEENEFGFMMTKVRATFRLKLLKETKSM